MEEASGDNGNSDNTKTVDVATPQASGSFMQSLRHSLPTLGSRGREEATSATPPKPLHQQNMARGDGGNRGDESRESAAGSAPHLSHGPEGGVKGSGDGGVGGGDNSGGGGGGTTDAAAAAAVAAAAHELAAMATLPATGPAAVESPVTATNQEPESRPSTGKQAEGHLSYKYTKEELLARHWGMNLLQMKRVKALLRMGVYEEDLEIADRLLKMGRSVGWVISWGKQF